MQTKLKMSRIIEDLRMIILFNVFFILGYANDDEQNCTTLFCQLIYFSPSQTWDFKVFVCHGCQLSLIFWSPTSLQHIKMKLLKMKMDCRVTNEYQIMWNSTKVQIGRLKNPIIKLERPSVSFHIPFCYLTLQINLRQHQFNLILW